MDGSAWTSKWKAIASKHNETAGNCCATQVICLLSKLKQIIFSVKKKAYYMLPKDKKVNLSKI